MSVPCRLCSASPTSSSVGRYSGGGLYDSSWPEWVGPEGDGRERDGHSKTLCWVQVQHVMYKAAREHQDRGSVGHECLWSCTSFKYSGIVHVQCICTVDIGCSGTDNLRSPIHTPICTSIHNHIATRTNLSVLAATCLPGSFIFGAGMCIRCFLFSG